jgi:4-amino-4-deoxy-L-arabinose transferase-like glycosyltransferase
VPAWLVFEAVPTKLPHYVMPIYPAIAIVTVLAIRHGFVGPQRPAAKPAALLIALIPIGLTIGLVAAGWSLDGIIPYAALPGLIAASLVSVHAWRLFTKGEVVKAAVAPLVA